MTIKTRDSDERFQTHVPDFKLEKRERPKRPKYRTWRDDPDTQEAETPSKPVAGDQQASNSEAPLGEPIASDDLAASQINGEQSQLSEACEPIKQEANGKQTTSKSVAKHQQTGSKPVAKRMGASNKREAKPIAIGEQTVSKLEANGKQMVSKSSFSRLTGVQKNLILIYYESSQLNGGQDTAQMTLDYLAELTSRDRDTLKDANRRLIQKGLLVRSDYKVGRGGWVTYRLPDEVREEVYRMRMVSKPVANGKQTVSKPPAQSPAKPPANHQQEPLVVVSSFTTGPDPEELLPVTSSTTTTAPSAPPSEIDYAWVKDIDIPAELSELISESHLRQLARHGFRATETDIVQASLDNLAFALSIGRQYKSPAGLFMAAMKRDGFVSPVESPEFNRERARRLMEADKAQVDAALQAEISRLAHEKSLKEQSGRGSLDDTPF